MEPLGVAAGAGSPAASRPALAWTALFAAFAAVALVVYRPALSGAFVADDFGYIVANPYVRDLSWQTLLALLDPWGAPALYTANWAPVHLLGHAVEWQLWGPRVEGYHVVNVLGHAAVSTLLVAWLASRGLPFAVCALGGAFFLVHPANVEAVAWIFQLKTILALGLSLAALLVHPRSGALGLLLFGLALLTKASALFALPVAAVLWWCSAGDPSSGWRRNGPWLLGWALLLALYSQPQFFSFERMGRTPEPLAEGAAATFRTIVAIGGRYLAMGASGYGVSAFHSPPAAQSWLDPWWLAGLGLGALLAGRCMVALAGRREDAAHWAGAAAAWAPVSQIFPFLYPMADRYLYFILPGLIGGGLCWLRQVAPRALPARPPGVAIAVAAVALLGLASWSHQRAGVWLDDATLTRDAARHYPDGLLGRVARAQEAAARGDAEAAGAALEAAAERGFDNFLHLVSDPSWARVRGTPPFRRARAAVTRVWLRHNLAMQAPGQADLRKRGTAYLLLGERDRAEAALAAALERGGAFDAEVRRELAELRARLRADERRRERREHEARPDADGPR